MKKKRRPKIVFIQDPKDTKAYALEQRAEKLLDERNSLMEVLQQQQQTYKAVQINSRAKSLWEELQSAKTQLQEKLGAVNERLQELTSGSEKSLQTRILLLEHQIPLLKSAIEEQRVLHTHLAAIEKELYPELGQQEGKVFQESRKTVAELYALLKQQINQLQTQLKQYPSSLQEVIEPDLQLLQACLRKIDDIAQVTEQIYKNSQGGVITKDLYAANANQLLALGDIKFSVDQQCKLITDRLNIAKQDEIIALHSKDLEKIYTQLAPLHAIAYQAAHIGISSRFGDLTQQLKDAVLTPNYQNKLIFSAAEYQPQIPLTSINWNDDPEARNAITEERANLLTQLAEKRKVAEKLMENINTHQQALKQVIQEDLQFYIQRAQLYDALTSNPRNSALYLERVHKALNYPFQLGIDASEYVIVLNDLLSYGFEADTPTNSALVRNLQKTHQHILQLHTQFIKEYPELSISKDGAVFKFKGLSYPVTEDIRKELEDYVTAQLKIDKAFKQGEEHVSYAQDVDYAQELAKIKRSKLALEHSIQIHTKKQEDALRNIKDIAIQCNKLEPFKIEGNGISYKGINYPLEPDAITAIENFNQKYSHLQNLLTEPVKAENYSVIKEQFKQIEAEQSSIVTLLKNNQKNIEKNRIIAQLSQQVQLTEKKLSIVNQIITQINTELRALPEDDFRIPLLLDLQQCFTNEIGNITSLTARMLALKESLTPDTVDAAKISLNDLVRENRQSTHNLITSLKTHFDEKLPALSADSIFNSLMKWLNKYVIEPVYELLNIGKPARVGFFAHPAEKNLLEFRKDLLPELHNLEQKGLESAG